MDDRAFGIVNLPSEGKFYKNGCKRVKLFYLDGGDEEILTSLDLIENGEMVDFLLNRKVAAVEGEPYIDPENMLVGDRIFLVVSLRASMNSMIHISIPPTKKTESPLLVEYDLNQLTQKEIGVLPDEKGEFSYMLPTSRKSVKFRLMIGQDEKYLRTEVQRSKDSLLNISKRTMLTQLVTEIEGERDKIMISNVLKRLPLQDFRDLDKYIADITPGLDLNIEVPSPRGGTYKTFLRFDIRFWYPDLEAI